MTRFKWFWITFSAWCLIATVGAWAVIYSPFRLDSKKVCEFEAQINGKLVKSQILVTSTSLDLSLDGLTSQWQEQGFECVSKNINLASVLLKIPKKYWGALNSLAQIRMFQNNDDYRLLGLWSDPNDHQTYQWITDVPKGILKAQTTSTSSFPFRPPTNASNFMVIKTEKMETLMWCLPSGPKPDQELMNFSASQGFAGRLWSKRLNESVFLLQKGSLRLIATAEQDGNKNVFSLVKIN